MGCVYGYLVLKISLENHLVSAACLFAWAFLMNFIRQNTTYAYVGIVSAFTSGIVILGFSPSPSLSLAEYAMARIEMTCYGVGIWLFVSVTIFSTNEAAACRERIVEALDSILKESELMGQSTAAEA